MRGHYHFDAWKIWKNVPYYTEADEDFRKPNTADIVPNIMQDFTYAIDNLPETQSAVGRATKGAAQAYLGKLHLYTGDYGKAKEQFDAVVNSGKYALLPCFHDVFTEANENGSEMIFSIQASVNDGTSEGQNGNFADRLRYPNGGGTFSCCGFHQPSQNLVNSHKVDANGLPFITTFNNADATASDPLDPRVDWTIGRDDVPFLVYGTTHLTGFVQGHLPDRTAPKNSSTCPARKQVTVGATSNSAPLIRPLSAMQTFCSCWLNAKWKLEA
ncbi:MAG: hypothetical protein IPO07_28405 [Haliscomenobacter sp.]|nr:RagB/SusD family nutrient uptake outer membrane protein [Haliscomenobacter sp.]MBK9492271.1 hypothetical protein [Haliscomenobacter sp.]